VNSVGEETFRLHCLAYGIPFEAEYRFCPTRRWRADYFIPAKNLLIEIEGGTWNQGRHNRAQGYRKDLEKYNTATKMGFRLLRYTTEMVAEGTAIDDVRKVLEER
jgi:very-short-patch-repair endonuclease